MKNKNRTKKQLLTEIDNLNNRISKLNKLKTKINKAKDKIKAEKDKLQFLMDGLSQAKIGVDVVGLDYKVISQNKILKDRFGDITGKTCYEEYMGFNTPCDFCPMVKAIKNNTVEMVELKGRDGRDYEITSAPLTDPDGITDKAIEVVNDITKRKKTEEKARFLSSFVEYSADGMAIADIDGKLLYANDSWVRMHSYKSSEELVGQHLSIFHNKEQLKNDVEPFNKKAIENGSNRGEVGHIRKDGLPFQTMMTTTVLKDNKGNPKVLTAIARDITEQKKAEEQIKKNLKEKEIMLKEIHHRVKNNMQVISSLINLQAKGTKDKKAQEMLTNTRNRVMSMALVHERLYKGKDLASIDFRKYLEQMSVHLMSYYRELSRNIKLKRDIEDVSLDITKAVPLGLIANEIITNSLKHAFPKNKYGEIKIELNKKGKVYYLTISDNGKGFPKDKDINKPTSMGLDLVNSLVKQINGKIELFRDQGTTFKIKFKE